MPRPSPSPSPRRARPRGVWQAVERAFEALLALVGALAILAILFGVSADSRPRTLRVAPAPVAPRAQVAETERDGALRVKVVGREGQALAGALVRLYWQRERRYFDAGQALTDEQGLATLGRVPRGSLWVLADAEGHARASTQVVVEGGA
ncbi:MAG TPA: hypothetical protein VEQ58_14790, partial [Polyangiaceae bacterium]|nr:hypothetical protein [Polyangiaceae bacterium]